MLQLARCCSSITGVVLVASLENKVALVSKGNFFQALMKRSPFGFLFVDDSGSDRCPLDLLLHAWDSSGHSCTIARVANFSSSENVLNNADDSPHP